MKNLNFLLLSTCGLFMSSCGETLEVIDWIDRAKEECEVANSSGEICIAVKCTVSVREGKIKSIQPWSYNIEEWYNGECKEAFLCVSEYLEGKNVLDRSGDYEHSILIMPATE